MAKASMASAQVFQSTATVRLQQYLEAQQPGRTAVGITPLTPDASTRAYFRVGWLRGTAIVCVYPEPFDPDFHPYLDVTRLMAAALLPVPEVYAVDGSLGVIVQEDLGDKSLARSLEQATGEEHERYRERAICLIASIQAATESAAQLNSIAARLAFDEAKLSWELSFFLEHYFGSYRKEKLPRPRLAELRTELNDIAAGLAERPRVLCHRDFHAMNIMVDRADQLRIIDHQDARMGPVTYDLVSLLMDRQTELPLLSDVRANRLVFLEARRRAGLPAIDPDELAHEFRLMTVQRCLKAAGTFSYQTAVNGRAESYERYISPMLRIVKQSAEWLERFPALQAIISERI